MQTAHFPILIYDWRQKVSVTLHYMTTAVWVASLSLIKSQQIEMYMWIGMLLVASYSLWRQTDVQI